MTLSLLLAFLGTTVLVLAPLCLPLPRRRKALASD